VTTVLAGLIVLFALTGPGDISHPTFRIFLRIPLEGIVAAAVLLLLPARPRRWAAALAGLVIGLLAVEKIVDIGFYAVLDRPFDLVLDWSLLGPAASVLTGSLGRAGMIGAVVGALVLVVAGLVLTTLSALRLSRIAGRHRPAAVRVVAALAVVWLALAAFDVEFVPDVPVADRSTAALVQDRADQVRAGLRDRQEFAAEAAVDPYRDAPGDQLLAGLRGKDVIVSFVESYGRSAIEDPQYAKQINPVLDAGSRRLAAAGFATRSAFLTSSTVGGRSWLAHATFQSGLWISNQQRYRTLVSSDRLTFSGAFQRAGWRTVSVEPANSEVWPGREFFGYDHGYDLRNLGYRGPRFSYSTMPDQYTFSALQRAERTRTDRAPVMAGIALVSSHAPWTPTPRLIDWADVGDGSVFGPMAEGGVPGSEAWRSRSVLRAVYRESVAYSLSTVISYVEKYGDENLVLVFLGDHQPASYITGVGASRDVPITIVARDRAVLDRISGWGWQDGLRPGPRAPVWRMDTFRDRFLTTFAR